MTRPFPTLAHPACSDQFNNEDGWLEPRRFDVASERACTFDCANMEYSYHLAFCLRMHPTWFLANERQLSFGPLELLWCYRTLDSVLGAYALGNTAGPALGGLLSEPTKHFPSVFSSNGFFAR